MTETEALAVLRRFCERAGTQVQAARDLQISTAFLSDILHGRRNLSDELLDKLGYVRESVIRKKAS